MSNQIRLKSLGKVIKIYNDSSTCCTQEAEESWSVRCTISVHSVGWLVW